MITKGCRNPTVICGHRYLYLKSFDFPCKLTNVISPKGIIVTHRDFLPGRVFPKSNQLFVCIKADRDRHPFPQLHIVQNPDDDLMRQRYTSTWKARYIPHWPQGGLIQRDRSRGNRFENIAYIGVEEEITMELKVSKWAKKLNHMGLTWYPITEKEKWHNYS